MPLILGTNSIKDVGYDVANSCRFQDSASEDLSRSISSTGNNKTYTVSAWVKRVELGQSSAIFGTGDGGANNDARMCFFDADDEIEISYYNSGYTYVLKTTRKFRDLSAWYHLCILFDTTQSTEADRVKIYVNGVQETSFTTATYPSLNASFNFGNTSYNHYVNNMGGRNIRGSHYIAELVYLDGTALDVSNFGEFDSDSGIWKPVDVSGLSTSKGTNGVYFDFEDSSALGNDVWGSTDYTVSNLTALNQTTDTCTNNFATLNPLASITDPPTFLEGNLQAAVPTNGLFGAISTIGVNSGKWYAEFKKSVTSDNDMAFGIISDLDDARVDASVGSLSGGNSYAYRETGKKITNGTESTYGDSYGTTDIVGIALDLDNNYVYFSKNGTWQNSGDPTSGSSGTGAAFNITAPSSTVSGFYFINVGCTSAAQSGTFQCNFGNPIFSISSGNSDGNGYGNFEYAVPSGYYALNTKNLAEYG